MRKLATIRKILDIQPIKKADAIELARVDGWMSVVKKGLYKVGDLAIYVEVDSFVPHELQPELSKGKEVKVFNGVEGQPLRTVRLRGQLSQGLLFPLDTLWTHPIPIANSEFDWKSNWTEDDVLKMDVTAAMGIQLWEPPIPEELQGEVKPFPTLVPKTEVGRIQNLVDELQEWQEDGSMWYPSEKIDGTSMTVYVHNEHLGVCGRSWEFLSSVDNLYTRTAKNLGLYGEESKLINMGRNLALQGEMVGTGVKGGIKYGLTNTEFLLFRVYDIDNGKFLHETDVVELAMKLGIKTVPFFTPVTLKGKSAEQLLTQATAVSAISNITGREVMREGLVFSNYYSGDSFKVISNEYLLSL